LSSRRPAGFFSRRANRLPIGDGGDVALVKMNPNLYSADWRRLEAAYRLCRELPQP